MSASPGFHRIKKKETLFCSYCSKGFPIGVSLKSHYLEDHPGKPFKCTNCQQEFVELTKYIKHRIDKHRKPYACNSCDFRAVDSRGVKRHLVKCTLGNTGSAGNDRKPRNSGIPANSGNTEKARNTGNSESTGNASIGYRRTRSIRRPSCYYCNIKFIDLKSFDEHHQTEHPDQPYVCAYCQKQFSQRDALIRHRTANHLIKQWACSICKYKASNILKMKEHVEKCTGNTTMGYQRIASASTYSCFHCNIEFIDLKSFEEHHKIEHSAQPYVCEHCQRQCKDRSAYSKHKRNKHQTHYWSCNNCDYTSNKRSLIQVHIQKKHLQDLDKG